SGEAPDKVKPDLFAGRSACGACERIWGAVVPARGSFGMKLIIFEVLPFCSCSNTNVRRRTKAAPGIFADGTRSVRPWRLRRLTRAGLACETRRANIPRVRP